MDEAESRSLDLVQRMIVSALLVVVLGGPTLALAGYGVYGSAVESPARIGLAALSAVVGLLAAGAINVINRKAPYAPTLLIGLVPAAIAGFLILR